MSDPSSCAEDVAEPEEEHKVAYSPTTANQPAGSTCFLEIEEGAVSRVQGWPLLIGTDFRSFEYARKLFRAPPNT